MPIAIITLVLLVAAACWLFSNISSNDRPNVHKYVKKTYPDIRIIKIEYVAHDADGTRYAPVSSSHGRRFRVIGKLKGEDKVLNVQTHGLTGVYERDF